MKKEDMKEGAGKERKVRKYNHEEHEQRNKRQHQRGGKQEDAVGGEKEKKNE